MSNEHQNNIEKLGKQVEVLSNTLGNLSKTDDLKNLLLVIRKPGWTTPAEVAFALGIVESLNAQAHALMQLRGALVKASGSVTIK